MWPSKDNHNLDTVLSPTYSESVIHIRYSGSTDLAEIVHAHAALTAGAWPCTFQSNQFLTKE